MLFNSIEFALFLPIVFVIYWLFSKDQKKQNIIILISSYLFYGWWDWKFLTLIFFSSCVDFTIGILLSHYNKTKVRKRLLYLSILINIGLLIYFKYCNFFISSFVESFSHFGYNINITTLNIILPVGISFYTFQTLSYTIDVYNKKINASKDIISFFAFVSFFPQLVAGPIERASNLLPQFWNKRNFNVDLASDGMRQMLWGLFKKIIIADNCAIYVNNIFDNYTNYSGQTLLLGAILFSFQIYGDFSGYSDIAIGTARLFGFNLTKNFAFPYFSRDIAEFWRRWHISLSRWFRDYIYIPLGGSRGNLTMKIRNTFIIFIVSGFWHGANLTFITWGFLHAVFFIPLLISGVNRKNLDNFQLNASLKNDIYDIFKILTTFTLVSLTWIFFRAESLSGAINYLSKIFSLSILETQHIVPRKIFFLLIIFIFIEWFQRNKEHALEIKKYPKWLRSTIYLCIVLSIFFLGNYSSTIEFIYFQF